MCVSNRSHLKINSPTMTIKASKRSFNFFRLFKRPSFVLLWISSTCCVDTIPRVHTPTNNGPRLSLLGRTHLMCTLMMLCDLCSHGTNYCHCANQMKGAPHHRLHMLPYHKVPIA